MHCLVSFRRASAEAIGIDPVITVSANASGGVVGKMISPQSIAVGAAAIGLVGKESDLFRFTVKHSFIMLFLMCIITLVQAYVLGWMVPKYKIIEELVASSAYKEHLRRHPIITSFGCFDRYCIFSTIIKQKKGRINIY